MKRYNINWTAKALSNQIKKGNVNFDNAVQRNLVWDSEKKSLLIHSMIYNYAVPAMYFVKQEETTINEEGEEKTKSYYDSLDGKQRSNAIYEFLNGWFSLSVNTPPVYDDDGKEEDISGMTFSQLPEWAQDRVKDYNLTIYYYEDMTETEIREFFRRLNNGKPLSAVELTRVNTPSLEAFQEIAKHPVIKNVTTPAAKKRFLDENIAMQLYHILVEDAPDFSTKTFRNWAKSVMVNGTHKNMIMAGLDSVQKFIESLDLAEDKKVLRTVTTRTHFVSCAYFCTLTVDGNADQVDINKTLRKFFFGSPTISDEYNKTVGAGSAKPLAVQARKAIIKKLADEISATIPF